MCCAGEFSSSHASEASLRGSSSPGVGSCSLVEKSLQPAGLGKESWPGPCRSSLVLGRISLHSRRESRQGKNRIGGAESQVPFFGVVGRAFLGSLEWAEGALSDHRAQHCTSARGARVLCAWWKNNLCLVDERSACKYLVRAGDWETRGRFRDLGMLGRVWAGFGQGGWEQPSLTEEAQLGLCCLGRGHLTAQR